MKKLFLLLLAGLAGVTAFAQPFSAYEEVMADVERAGGVHRMYPTDQPRPTAAPKGYKPFYVSHLGRHGARFALGHTVYEDILAVWENAREKGWLTPEGEQFYQEYVSIYPLLAKREGQLTVPELPGGVQRENPRQRRVYGESPGHREHVLLPEPGHGAGRRPHF